MPVRFDLRYTSAFVLRLEAVSRVWAILESRVGPVSASASCADHARRKFTSLERLLAFENTSAKAIETLELTAMTSDRGSHAIVSFEPLSEPISVRLTALEESELSQVRGELRDALDGTKAWYSAISRIDVPNVIFASFFLLWLVMSIAWGGPSEPAREVGLGQAVTLALQVVVLLAGIGVACWAVWGLHRRYFPRAFFALGHGAERYKVDESVRWAVLIGLVVSMFGSLVVAFLAA